MMQFASIDAGYLAVSPEGGEHGLESIEFVEHVVHHDLQSLLADVVVNMNARHRTHHHMSAAKRFDQGGHVRLSHRR